MTHPSRILAIALTWFGTPLILDAQTCLGLAPFSVGRIQLGASADFGEDAKAFSANLSFGSTNGPLGGVSVGTVDYDELDENGTTVGAQLGWQAPVGTQNRVQLCPVVGATYGFGPDQLGSDVSSWSVFFGLQLGISTDSSAQLRLVPTVGAALAYAKLEVDGFLNFEESETFGILNLGVGFVVNTRVSILPSVDIPVGLEGADPNFGIMLAVNF
jgi:hypothetical protein